MSEKISDYTADATSNPIKNEDLLDFSNEDGAGDFDVSKKITVDEFKAFLNIINLYIADGSLLGNRTVSSGGFFTKFDGGDVIVEMNNESDDYAFIVNAVGAVEAARLGYDQISDSAVLELQNLLGTWFEANDGNLTFGNIPSFVINNDGSFSLGENAIANDFRNVIIGNGADSGNCPRAVVIGDSASSPTGTAGNVIIGALATTTANSQPSVSIGFNSNSADQGTSVGNNSLSGGSGVAIGSNSKSLSGVAIGINAELISGTGVSIGSSSKANSTGVSVGQGCTALISGGIAVGYLIVNVGNSAIGIGVLAVPSGTRSISIGRSAESTGAESIAIGYESEVTTANSIGLGKGTAATAAGATMIGFGNISTKITNSVENSIGFGWDTSTPDVLFAKTANQYINGTGGLGIGTKTPNSKAKVDIESTTQGFLKPRMTTVERDAIATPPAGLEIYNLTTNKMNFYNGSAWEQITSA